MSTKILENEYLYEQIAGRIAELIQHGTLQAGEKLPSIRRLSQQEKVSISTVMQAYYWLESKGLHNIEPGEIRIYDILDDYEDDERIVSRLLSAGLDNDKFSIRGAEYY